MKKFFALLITVLLIAGAAFGYLKVAKPYMTLNKTTAAASEMDGEYWVSIQALNGDVLDTDKYLNLDVLRNGDILCGDATFPIRLTEEQADSYEVTCKAYVDLKKEEMLIQIGSIVESVLPESILGLANIFGLMDEINKVYISAEQITEIVSALVEVEGVFTDREASEDMENVSNLMENTYAFPLFNTRPIKDAGLLQDGFYYFKIKQDTVNADVYIGCADTYTEGNASFMLFFDYSGEGVSDYAITIQAKEEEVSLTMPESILTEEQTSQIIELIGQIKELLGE